MAVLTLSSLAVFGQGARNIRINEVMLRNESSLQDEFGQRLPWVELVNVSYSTYNVRDMYITTDRAVLDDHLSAPERISMMSVIPSGDDRTSMSARVHLVFYLASTPTHGTLHLAAPVDPAGTWVALYDGNGIDLIDSVSVPPLAADRSYARHKDGSESWDIKAPDAVTPGINNYIEVSETKTARWKRDDPHGIVVTILSMGIVFSCLALLYVVFRLLGIVITRKRKQEKAAGIDSTRTRRNPNAATTTAPAAVSQPAEETVPDVVMAIVALAIQQHLEDSVHDQESGIITIHPHHSHWQQ